MSSIFKLLHKQTTARISQLVSLLFWKQYCKYYSSDLFSWLKFLKYSPCTLYFERPVYCNTASQPSIHHQFSKIICLLKANFILQYFFDFSPFLKRAHTRFAHFYCFLDSEILHYTIDLVGLSLEINSRTSLNAVTRSPSMLMETFTLKVSFIYVYVEFKLFSICFSQDQLILRLFNVISFTFAVVD